MNYIDFRMHGATIKIKNSEQQISLCNILSSRLVIEAKHAMETSKVRALKLSVVHERYMIKNIRTVPAGQSTTLLSSFLEHCKPLSRCKPYGGRILERKKKCMLLPND